MNLSYKSNILKKCIDLIQHNLKIRSVSQEIENSFATIEPKYNFDYLCDPKNKNLIEKNIEIRKGVGNILEVQKLYKIYSETEDVTYKEHVKSLLNEEARKIPNKTHLDVVSYDDTGKELKIINDKPKFNYKPLNFSDITRKLNILRTDLGNLTGPRSYVLMSDLAQLETALIRYTVRHLLNHGFELVSVPDILPSYVIEGCGMSTTGERNQVYRLHKSHGSELCLSGTSEMALAGLFTESIIPDLSKPMKLAAVSRCYRAETSSIAQERGIYRVHNFTKVEMFVYCKENESDQLLEEIRNLEEALFQPLGIHMRIIDMPPHELGAPAYRKYDIEAWMPGRGMWGEISSCSNCTDFQSRRLNIQYKDEENRTQFPHTINGTACAIPRMLITLLETHQNGNGTISIPEVLQKYTGNKSEFVRSKEVPDVKILKGTFKKT